MSTELTTLAEGINREYRAAREAAQSAVDHAIRVGELLLKAKAGVEHGQWSDWIRRNCEVSERSTRAYMRLAREVPKLSNQNRQRVADLPLREALRAVSEGAARLAAIPDGSIEPVCAAVESGQSLLRAIANEQRGTKHQVIIEGESRCTPAPAEGRTVGIRRNDSTGQWALVYGPNVSGAEFDRRIEQARTDPFSAQLAEDAADLERKAAELETEARRMREAAAKARESAHEAVTNAVRRDGPAYAFTETLLFEPLGEAIDEVLQTKSEAEIAGHLLRHGKVQNHDMRGDLRWMGISNTVNAAATWSGIGFEAGL